MVTVTGFKKRTNSEGKTFNVLILQGDLEFLPSKTNGRLYATAKSCTVSCTFNDVLCEGLIGKTLPGAIEKMETHPYDYVVPESGEVLTLTHSWYYNPNPKSVEQEVFNVKAVA